MPEKLEQIRSAIASQLRKDHPEWDDDTIEKKSWAMAQAQYSKMKHESSDWHVLEFYTPIEESATVDDVFIIRGTAISETTTHNNHKYVAEELEKAAPSMRDRPLLVDHRNEVSAIVGRINNSFFDRNSRSIRFEAQVMDAKIKEMVKDGRIKNVSIGAYAEDLVQEEGTSNLIAKGIRIAELSLVAVPADEHATFAQALMSSFKIKESMQKGIIESAGEIDEQMVKCPECGKEFENKEEMDKHMKDKHNESFLSNIDKRRSEEMMEGVTAEANDRVKMLEQTIADLKAEKRQTLVEKYQAVCKEKLVKEKDVSKASEEAISMLIEQLKEIEVKTVIAEKPSFKGEIATDIPEQANSFMVEKTGSNKFAIWAKVDPVKRMPIVPKW